VPADQGGFVNVSWGASDVESRPGPGIAEYRVYRAAPGSVPPIAWAQVGTLAATGIATYGLVVPTTLDSLPDSCPRSLFMVEARATSAPSSDHWGSAPDSGYSADNLFPATPAALTGEYAAGNTALHWARNGEGDLAAYRIYRGDNTAFTPAPGNLLATVADTGYADAAGVPYAYKLSAVDAHGNESAAAAIVPNGTLGVHDIAPASLGFAAPSPNPAGGELTLDWTLSRAGRVRLSAYDAAGRLVRVLDEGDMAVGAHHATFRMLDASGHALASGIYLLRLEAEGRVLTRRLAAIR